MTFEEPGSLAWMGVGGEGAGVGVGVGACGRMAGGAGLCHLGLY